MGCGTTALAYGGKGANAALCQSGHTLPFTGFNLVYLAVGAVLIILAGITLFKIVSFFEEKGPRLD